MSGLRFCFAIHYESVHKNLLTIANPLLDSDFREQISLLPRVFERDSLPKSFAVADYEESLARLFAEFKHTGNLKLVEWLVEHLAQQIKALHGSQAWLLVPVPSATKATIKRGFAPANLIASSLAKKLGSGSKVESAIWLRREVADQAALSIADRARNLAGAMVANPSLNRRAVNLVAVVDDVVTTGASAAEAVRAMAEIGVSANAVFALAETLRKTQQKV